MTSYFYQPQGKVMFSQACVSHSVHKGRGYQAHTPPPPPPSRPGVDPGGPWGSRSPLTPGFEAPKLSFFKALFNFSVFF